MAVGSVATCFEGARGRQKGSSKRQGVPQRRVAPIVLRTNNYWQ